MTEPKEILTAGECSPPQNSDECWQIILQKVRQAFHSGTAEGLNDHVQNASVQIFQYLKNHNIDGV